MSPSQADNACDTSNTPLIHPDESINLVHNEQSMPSNLQLSLSPEHISNSQTSPFLEKSGSVTQPQSFEYDLAACDIDWDFPMNWLPYNNQIETNYCSILGLGTNLPSTASLDPSLAHDPIINKAESDLPVIDADPHRLPAATSLSPGSTLAVSPQLSMGSDRTTPGDLYATSSNGARRPCTAKSKQLFPPPDLRGYQQLSFISQDSSLRTHSISYRAFPDLDRLIVDGMEGYQEPALTEPIYSKIYDAFTHTCLDSDIFQNHYTSVRFPSLMILDYCAKLFFEHFNPIFPLVHPQVADLNTNWVLTLAICAVGSQYSATKEIDACVLPFHEFLRRVLIIQLEKSELGIPLAQALVLSQVGLLYYGGKDLQYTAYQRAGNLHNVIKFYRRRSDTQFEVSTRDRLNQTQLDLQAEWMIWVEGETLRRLCYFIWLLDRMGCYLFDDHHTGTFDVDDIGLPHDGLWAQTSASDWATTYRRVEENPSLALAVNELFRERTAKTDLGEFSRVLLLHAVYQEYSTVRKYCKRPLSTWMPQNNPERHGDDSDFLRLSDSNWRNAALDCVDTLHWAANATIASLLGAEHPTVLHLHFSRVVLVYSFKARRLQGEMRSGSVTRQASPDHLNAALFDDDNPTFIRLDRPNDDEMVQLFVRTGVLKAYISGVGDIYASTAPPKILQEGRRILESVSLAWGRSREYLDLLQALG
ncbi:hypothetical protein FSARC_8527 [Fusarium sarcochroum]|uniref:Xylanolytic transcriptional activator regulatory domain-containing protein n=1 Tax=Fusarium sarcochroum TaxID=1208366 RepID=A0A8H4TST0_9HYPO|nr:hypothetical protein FSARC_8527 [Fusarium sarcochroum]